MKKLFLLITLLATSFSLWAQINPKEGYIITLDNDTVTGTIDYRTEMQLSQSCSFAKTGESNYSEYLPGQIEGFGINETGEYYRSLKPMLEDEELNNFFQILVKGYLSLYVMQKGVNSVYVFETADHRLAAYDDIHEFFQEELKIRRKAVLPVSEMLEDDKMATQQLWSLLKNRENMKSMVMGFNKRKTGVKQELKVKKTSTFKQILHNLHPVVMAGANLDFINVKDVTQTPPFYAFDAQGIAPLVSVGANYQLIRVDPGLYIDFLLSYSKVNIFNDDIGPQYIWTHNPDTGGSIPVWGPTSFKTEGNQVLISVGAEYRIGQTLKVQPLIRAGVNATIYSKVDFEIEHTFDSGSRYLTQSQKEAWFKWLNTDIRNQLNGFTEGIYLGTGFAVPFKVGTLLFYADYNFMLYNFDGNNVMNKNLFKFRLGYEF